MTTRRIKNIIKRILNDGQDFYTNQSPRITKAEIKEIESLLDVKFQTDHINGAQAGPIAVYPLGKEFNKKASDYLIQERVNDTIPETIWVCKSKDCAKTCDSHPCLTWRNLLK